MPFWSRDRNHRAKLEHKMCVAKETPEPVFDLSECNLHEVPSGVFSMCRVFRKEVLLLQNNLLRSLDSGGSLKDLSLLQVLNLSHNKFSSLPKDICNLCNLEVLNLENNYLKNLPDSFKDLNKLHSLNIKGNKFRSFPMVLCKLCGLRSLSISGNPNLKVLPKELSNLMCLENLELDADNTLYPPPDICSNGAECIIQFLCKESNRKYDPQSRFTQKEVDSMDNARRDSRTSWEDTDLIAAYQQYQQTQEQRQKELIQMEEFLKENDVLQAQLASDALVKRQKLLEDVAQEQEKVNEEIRYLQKKKEVEKQRLLETLMNVEDHSAELIEQLMKIKEKNKNVDNILETLEQDRIEIEEMFTIQQEELEEIRKNDILDAMKNMLEAEERQREYEAEKLQITKQLQDRTYEDDSKINDLLSDRALDQQALINKLLEEETLQKEAFEALQLQKDKRHQEITYQIKLIEEELAKLTMAEVKKQDFKVNVEINVLAERRAALAQLLADLLSAKELREEELKKRLVEMEEMRLNQIKDFWLLQYQKLMDRKPPEVLNAEDTMDSLVKQLLLEAGAVNYVPLFAIKSVTWKELLGMSFTDLKRLGVSDSSVCEAILSKCEEHVAAEKLGDTSKEPAPEPSAPPAEDDDDDEFRDTQPSAPPLSPDTNIKLFCQTECVICLDKKSTTVFIPCGHVCCCWRCSVELSSCPMCRDVVQTKFILTT